MYNYFKFICGYNLVVECHASDLIARVRFSLPAPFYSNLRTLKFGLKVNSWGETSEKCFTPAFLMGLNKTHKKWSKPTFLCNSNKPIA